MDSQPDHTVVSVMLAVSDASLAAAWYARALGATELWNLGSVVGMEIAGAPFMIGEPQNNGWDTPQSLGMPTVRVEVFCDDPDAFLDRAVQEGATDRGPGVREHQMPWGTHRQGGFNDPFGHIWFVGDASPLARHP